MAKRDSDNDVRENIRNRMQHLADMEANYKDLGMPHQKVSPDQWAVGPGGRIEYIRVKPDRRDRHSDRNIYNQDIRDTRER